MRDLLWLWFRCGRWWFNEPLFIGGWQQRRRWVLFGRVIGAPRSGFYDGPFYSRAEAQRNTLP